MKITDVRIRELTGTTHYADDLFQGRQRSPMDIYPEAKARTAQAMYKAWKFISEGDAHEVKGVFVEIDTDAGITGVSGPVNWLMKIYTLASVYDVPLIPHGASQHVNAHVSFAQNAVLAPMMEDLIPFRQMSQHFLAHPLAPVDGYCTPPEIPGIGLDIDESKIESERVLSWA